jgi:hypothetical protein
VAPPAVPVAVWAEAAPVAVALPAAVPAAVPAPEATVVRPEPDAETAASIGSQQSILKSRRGSRGWGNILAQ